MLSSVLGGLWQVEQADLLAPYVERYLVRAPVWAARGDGFAQVVGQSGPALLLTPDQRSLLDSHLAVQLPTVLRRSWSDWVDDLG